MRLAIALSILVGIGCSRGPHSPLIAAAREGNRAEIRRLLDAGADPNQPGGVNGWPPLSHAVHKGQHAAARALLEGGADPNKGDPRGRTALMMAAGYGDTRMVGLLLEGGANPALESADGNNALTLAMGGVADIDKFTLGQSQCEVVKLLLTAAPNLRVKDNLWGRLARRVAIRTGCASTLNLPSQ